MTTYRNDGDLVDSFSFRLGLADQISEDVFEVRNGDILLELFIQDESVLRNLHLACQTGQSVIRVLCRS